jgi:hypothetical protein
MSTKKKLLYHLIYASSGLKNQNVLVYKIVMMRIHQNSIVLGFEFGTFFCASV